MKIIKHGCVIDFNCPVCGCEFLMSEDECYEEASQDEKKGEEIQYLAVCPDCGQGDVPGYKKQYGELTEAEEPEEQEEQEEPEKQEEGAELKGRSTGYTK